MIVLDGSAAIEVLLQRASADRIEADLRLDPQILVPAHFEADTYAGLRRMVNAGLIARDRVAPAVSLLARMAGDRIPLAPLLPAAYQLLDRVGANDAFYVVLARERGATLLTSDGPLARAAEQLGVSVLYRETEATA